MYSISIYIYIFTYIYIYTHTSSSVNHFNIVSGVIKTFFGEAGPLCVLKGTGPTPMKSSGWPGDPSPPWSHWQTGEAVADTKKQPVRPDFFCCRRKMHHWFCMIICYFFKKLWWMLTCISKKLHFCRKLDVSPCHVPIHYWKVSCLKPLASTLE